MPLVQDQFRQKSRKLHESQLYLREDTTKQLNADPKDLWQFELICDEEKSVSGNDSEVDLACKKSRFKYEERHFDEDDVLNKQCHQQKNVRFDPDHCSSEGYTSQENECSEVDDGNERKCWEEGKRSFEKNENFCKFCDTPECRKCSVRHRVKVRPNDFSKTRRRSSRDEFETVTHRHSPKYHTNHGCGEVHANRTRSSWEYDEKMHRCGEWYNQCKSEERNPKSSMMLLYSKPYKHVHHAKKDKSPEKWKTREDTVSRQDCCYHRQKVLDRFEELPVVDESLEERSDATYNASISNLANINGGGSRTNFLDAKAGGKKDLYEKSPSWIICDKMESVLKGTVPYDLFPNRKIKARSRRTRLKSLKWQKALIHPVVEGSRKEMIGMMVLGQSGPEIFYSNPSSKRPRMPFRKSRSFPEDPMKSCDMPLNRDTKEVLVYASDPGRIQRTEPRAPEDYMRIEDKISNFDKNLDELVKSSQEKFLQSLAKDRFQKYPKSAELSRNVGNEKEAEGKTEETENGKKPRSVQLMPSELLSSRAPKSVRKFDIPCRETIVANVESVTIADSLNERIKQYRQGDKSEFSNLDTVLPPKLLEKDSTEASKKLLNMMPNDGEKIGGEGDAKEVSVAVRIPPREELDCGDHKRNDCQIHGKKEDEKEEITTEAMEKLSEEMHRQRRKKYFEEATATLMKQTEKKEEKLDKEKGEEQVLFDFFSNLVKDGCAISEKESENLKKILSTMKCESHGDTSSDAYSKTSYDTKENVLRYSKREDEMRKNLSEKKDEDHEERGDDCPSDGASKKFSGSQKEDNGKKWKKTLSRQHCKGSKKHLNVEKMKLRMIREALPSMAAENEAAHLRQLKKYINRFIDGVENKISSSSELRGKRRTKSKPRDSTSSDGSEVMVDARKLIDLVSNPFRRITSDMTIDMAKKLTDALVQESSSKSPKHQTLKNQKNSEGTEDVSLPCPTTSGSDQDEETEPTYLEALKKMRNDHINNIMMETRRLRELIRFLDRCNRLKL